FAELMRMADAPRASQPEPDLAANENFDIDLEREMLGEFGEPDTAPVQSSVADHWTQEPQQAAPAPTEEFHDTFDDLDLSLDLELEDEGQDLPPLSATEEP